jgi:hypothetical protein
MHNQIMAENLIHISVAEGASNFAFFMARVCGWCGSRVRAALPRWSGICTTLSSLLSLRSGALQGIRKSKNKPASGQSRCGKKYLDGD